MSAGERLSVIGDDGTSQSSLGTAASIVRRASSTKNCGCEDTAVKPPAADEKRLCPGASCKSSGLQIEEQQPVTARGSCQKRELWPRAI